MQAVSLQKQRIDRICSSTCRLLPGCLLLRCCYLAATCLPACLPTCPACRPPAITVATSPAVAQTTASVVVTPPSTKPSAGDWDKYELKVCPTNPAAACFNRDCTSLNGSPAATTCALTGLKAGTQYTVEVRGRCSNCGAGSAPHVAS